MKVKITQAKIGWEGGKMGLKEYLDEIEKNNCECGCKLEEKNHKRVCKVPPPDKISGIIISRDPPISWRTLYLENKESRERLFCAIPTEVFIRIEKFLCERITKEEKHCLYKVIDEKVYWTHFHKCFTDKKEEQSLKYEYGNANKCGDTWLKNEIDYAIEEGAKFIIALGKDVQKWVNNQFKGIEVFPLPHPSGANVGKGGWHPNSESEINRQIKCLLEICKSLC